MDTRTKFEKVIVATSDIENSNGYVRDYRHNVLSSITTNEYEDDLMEGAGSELKSKFAAIYSSSALVVNTFASFKRFRNSISLLGYNSFNNAKFERRFETGLNGTPPTLDFCLESNDVVIAIESKYLEILRQKEAKFVESYFNTDFGKELNHIILKYNGTKGFLDFAQLIKHCIGLGKYAEKTKKKCVLLYLYWLPLNYENYDIYKKHNEELELFKNDIIKVDNVDFIDMSYLNFWQLCREDNVIGKYIQESQKRYEKKID